MEAEFAANGGPAGHKRTLRAALAEGIFMLGFERNSDVVESSSFAPLCNSAQRGQQRRPSAPRAACHGARVRLPPWQT